MALKQLNLDKKDRERYSLANAAAYVIDPKGAGKRAKFEKDISDQVAKLRNDETDGIMVPSEILSHRSENPLGYPVPSHILTRQAVFGEPSPYIMPRHDAVKYAADMQARAANIAGNDAQGGALVVEELGSVIEAFVRSSLALQNIPTFDAVGSPVKIPGFSSVPAAAWTGETGAAPEQQPGFLLRSFLAKELRCMVKISRRLILQATGAVVENFVRNDIAISMATELDRAMLLGTGGSNMPLGIKGITGVNTVTLAANLMKNSIDAMGAVGKNNHRFNNMKWMLSWELCDKFKVAKKYGNTSRLPVLDEDGMINGIPVEVTSQIPGSAGFLGNWIEAALCLWEDLKLELDTKTLLHQGITRVFGYMTLDVNALRPSAFTYMS